MDDFGINADDFADGEVVFSDPIQGIRVTKYNIDANSYALKTEYLHAEALLSQCADDRSLSAGTRWGDGKIIGRLPFNILTDENIGLMDAIRENDGQYVQKFLTENPRLMTRDKI